jgi:hypothetical protein
MRRPMLLAAATAIVAVLLSPGTVLSVRAPIMPAMEPQGVLPVATSGTTGRIAKFATSTDLNNSALFQNGTNIGLGTTVPIARLDIRAPNALNIMAAQPYLTFRDTSAGNARHVIKSVSGGLNLLSQDYLNGSSPSAFVRIDRAGRVGFAGAANPQRAIQIGPSSDAMFTVEPSPGSPMAGAIRFGDNTGWRLVIGRSRDSSGGPLLPPGFQGTLLSLRDDGALDLRFPLGAIGTVPLCRTNVAMTTLHSVSTCQSSSLRYKTDIEPYNGGMDVIDRLRPIAFTRILSGTNDIGLAAEDVARIDLRLTYSNENGEVEGVRYELLSTAFINAFKEQQEQIERQGEQIEELQAALARLEIAQP